MEDSLLYKHLIFFEKYQSESFNIKEVFYFMLGYQLSSKEKWIADFNDFLEKKLIHLFADKQFDKLPVNWGEFIYEKQNSNAEGLTIFFNYLSEYKKYRNK